MRTVEVCLYKFEELSDKAKDRARDGFRQHGDLFAWGDEWAESLKAFAAKFGVRVKNWSIGYHGSVITTDAENGHFRGLKLAQIDRDESLTGFCGDASFLYPFVDTWKRNGSALVAFNEALYAGAKDWENDIEDGYSDEGIDDLIIANDYEFDEDGELQ